MLVRRLVAFSSLAGSDGYDLLCKQVGVSWPLEYFLGHVKSMAGVREPCNYCQPGKISN